MGCGRFVVARNLDEIGAGWGGGEEVGKGFVRVCSCTIS